MYSYKKNISSDQTIEILKKHGIDITEKEAETILNFLYTMALKEVKNEFEKSKSSALENGIVKE